MTLRLKGIHPNVIVGVRLNLKVDVYTRDSSCNSFVTIHARCRQTTERQTTHYDISRNSQCICNVRLMSISADIRRSLQRGSIISDDSSVLWELALAFIMGLMILAQRSFVAERRTGCAYCNFVYLVQDYTKRGQPSYFCCF